MADNLSCASRPTYVYDAYRGMKLDIDDMTYEEDGKGLHRHTRREYFNVSDLKIVCKSWPGDTVSSALMITKIKNEVGALKKCGHEYHASCIIMWLLMKKTCPICRSDVLDPTKSD